MNRQLDRQLRDRARNRCECCRLPQAVSRLRFPIDHIVARQHGGETESANLALCCGRCNQRKGPNLSGVDPESGRLTRLFHPRRDKWEEHLRYQGAMLVGLSEIGRATVAVLNINHPYNLAVRRALIEAGLFL